MIFIATLAAFGGCSSANVVPLEDWLAGLGNVQGNWMEEAQVRVLVLREGEEGGEEAATLYIEGDGRAYADRTRPSPDPTPRAPVALQLALADGAGGRVLYMGRPCQWQPAGYEGCRDARLWTTRRFEPDVVARQVDVALRMAGTAERVEVVGFSGGAMIAQAVAVRLKEAGRDVRLVTVAGNVDPAAVNAHHRVTAQPQWVGVDRWRGVLREIEQVHYVGTRDRIVPQALVRAYVRRLGAVDARVVEVDATHLEGWENRKIEE